MALQLSAAEYPLRTAAVPVAPVHDGYAVTRTADTAFCISVVYPELFWNYRYLYDYGYALHKTGDYAGSNEILQEGAAISSDPMFHNIIGKNFEALGDNDAAEGEYVKAHNMVPCRLYPLVLLMEMYSKTGNETEALEVAERILEMPVNHRNRTMMELREKAEEELFENDMQ